MKKLLFLLLILAGIYFFFSSGEKTHLFPDAQNQYYAIKSDVLSWMAKNEGENGKIEKAETLFKKSETAAEKITDTTDRIEKIIGIAQSRLETNKELMTKSISENIEKAVKEIGNDSGARNAISDADKKQILNQSASIYTQVENLPLPNSDPQIVSLFLFSVAKLYANDDKIDSAIETIEKIPDPYYQKAAWLILIKEKGNFDKMIEKMNDSSQQSFVLLSKLESLLKEERLEEAKSLIENFENKFLRDLGLWKIAYSQMENEDIAAAVETLKKLNN